MHAPRHPLTAWPLAATITICLSACSEYAHTNPVDPATPFTVTIVGGRDTLRSIGEVVTFEAVTSKPWNGPPPEWSSGPRALLKPLGDGRFEVVNADPQWANQRVGVTFGTRETVHRPVVVWQRPVRFSFSKDSRDYYTHALDTATATFTALGATGSLFVRSVDSLGHTLQRSNPMRLAVRDSSVVVVTRGIWGEDPVQVPGFVARRNGTTWVVLQNLERPVVVDSVLFTVRQVVRRVRTTPDCNGWDFIPTKVGDTRRWVPTQALDLFYHPVDGASIPAARWRAGRVGVGENRDVRVNEDGSITFLAVGEYKVWLQALESPPAMPGTADPNLADCWITVR